MPASNAKASMRKGRFAGYKKTTMGRTRKRCARQHVQWPVLAGYVVHDQPCCQQPWHTCQVYDSRMTDLLECPL